MEKPEKARAFILNTQVLGFMNYPGLARAFKARAPSLLCANPPDRNQEMGQDLRYTFLNSSWHTDARNYLKN